MSGYPWVIRASGQNCSSQLMRANNSVGPVEVTAWWRISRVVFSPGNVYVIGRSRIEKTNLSLGRSLHNRRCGLKLKKGVVSIVLFSLLPATALAQTRGGSLTLRYTSFSPIVSLVAGILILIFPKLLRYIVGFYLILVGLLGLFGR